MQQRTSAAWAEACANDGEFQLAARHWNGGLRLTLGDEELALRLDDGKVSPGKPATDAGVIAYAGPEADWERVLAAVPERFYNDMMASIAAAGGISVEADPVVHAQYYPAAMRAVELLRPAAPATPTREGEAKAPGQLDGGGVWHREGWFGAVLTGSRLLEGTDARARAESFLRSAIRESSKLVGG